MAGPGVQVELDTTVLPPIVVTPGGAGVSGGPLSAGALVKFLKPALTVSVNGQPLYHTAPAGEPTDRWGWVLVVVVVGVVGLAIYGGWMLARKA